MMIAAIIDIVASREADVRERRELDKRIRELLDMTYKRFKDQCVAIPTLTQGDSIELMVRSWKPIVFLFHTLLMESLEFRVGLGTGEVIIHKENADECDGPAFWNAREALDEIKSVKYMNRSAGFKIENKTPKYEETAVITSLLVYTTLLGFSKSQLQHCFSFIWKKNTVSEIAESTKTSKGNISKSLSKTPCYLLEKVITYLNQ